MKIFRTEIDHLRKDRDTAINGHLEMEGQLKGLIDEREGFRRRYEILREALTEWLVATPTRQDGTYDPINQPQACKAAEALRTDSK